MLHICYILKTLLDDEKQGRQFTVRQGRRSALQPAWFWKITVELLMMTAIRQNQLLHIRLCDLDLSGQQGMPRVLLQGNGSKNHDERWLPLPAELVPGMAYLQQQAIAQKMPLQGQLFNVGWFIDGMQEVRINGMTERQMDSFFTQLSARCGFRVTSHRFRHTLATALMREPERNIAQVKALLGHRSLSSTLVYIEDDPAEICKMLSRRLDSIRQLPGSKHFING